MTRSVGDSVTPGGSAIEKASRLARGTDGRRYLDFIAGWAVTCLGHSPPALVRAMREQSRELINASPALYNAPMIRLAKPSTMAVLPTPGSPIRTGLFLVRRDST